MMAKKSMAKTEVFLQSPLDFAGDLSATGWQLPDTITRDQYEDAGRLLGKMEDSKQWWLGDWWNAGAKWGEGKDICEKVGVAYSTAASAGSVAKAFEFCRRRQTLSFSHHVEAQSLETPEMQDRFLDWCICQPDTGEVRDKPKSVRDLREAVRSYMDEQSWTDSERERRAIVEDGGTVVAHMKDDEHLIRWAQFAGVYQRIDRKSDWGNPFVLPEDGDRDTVCDSFGVYLDRKPSLLKRLPELKGKVLGCWCHPERCHGEEIIGRIGDE